MIKHRMILLLSTTELGELLPHLHDDWAVSIESVVETAEPEKPKRVVTNRPSPARDAVLKAIEGCGERGATPETLMTALEGARMKATSLGPTLRRLVDEGLVTNLGGVWRRRPLASNVIDAEPAL